MEQLQTRTMTTVNVYFAGIPAKNSNMEKVQVLKSFAVGAKKDPDAVVQEVADMKYAVSDVAVIQGWVHEHSQSAPHLNFRKTIIDNQRTVKKRVIAIDSNLFLYRDPGNTKTYLRFSFDGIFPTTGEYFDNIVDKLHWQEIKSNIVIDLQPWRTDGDHILICLQRNGGWSMQGLNVMEWCINIISEIKKYSARPIVVRAHPGDRNAKNYLKLHEPNVTISENNNILDDFKNAWATITYNSSPGVASAIEGIPVFVTDPNAKNSQAFSVCNTDLKNIENPTMTERQDWIEKLAMSHWSFQDLESGKAWNHIKKFL